MAPRSTVVRWATPAERKVHRGKDVYCPTHREGRSRGFYGLKAHDLGGARFHAKSCKATFDFLVTVGAYPAGTTFEARAASRGSETPEARRARIIAEIRAEMDAG